MPSTGRVFPPQWNQDDQWRVAMKTEAHVTADFRPSYAEHIFDLRVLATPGGKIPTFAVEARSQDFAGVIFTLYYRRDGFSLEKVTRRDPGRSEEIVILNGNQPFIYYERRLPLIPDFPVADLREAAGMRKFTIAGQEVSQEVQLSEQAARITLQRIEPPGSLRVDIEWTAGSPWWSKIECSENPSPNSPLDGQIVASGYLLEESGNP
jgi:hypothetical protein